MSETMQEVVRRLEAMHQELQELRREVTRLRLEVRPAGAPHEQQILPFVQPTPDLQLVTLDQMAAMVRLQKRSLDRHRRQMPAPAVKGGGGRPTMWAWAEVRPWLETTFGRALPVDYPSYVG